MSSIGSLFASLTLQSSQFTQGLRNAVGQSNAAAGAIGSAMGRAAAFTTGALTGLGIAATAAFAVAAKSSFDFASSLTELAQQTGTTVEQYQILAVAAAGAGAEQATLDSALKKLNATLGEAKSGSEGAQEALSAIGIKPDQLNSLERGGDLLPMVMEGLKNVKGEAEQAAAAKKLFGKAAGELLPLLTSGAEGYNEQAEAAHKMGLITAEQAAKADEAADSMSALGMAIRIKLGGAIADNIPLITSMINWIGAMIDRIASGLRSFQIFAYKAALIQNQFQTGKDAVVEFLAADNPIQGYRNAKKSVQQHRQRRDNLQRGLDGLQNPKAQGIWDAKRGRWVSVEEQNSWKGQVGAFDLDEPNLRVGGGGGAKPKPGGGGGGGGQDPLKAAKDMVADLKFQQDQLERTDREQEVYNNLKRAGVEATSAFGKQIRSLTEDLDDAKALKEYNKRLEEMLKTSERAGLLVGLNDRQRLIQEKTWELQDLRPKTASKGTGDDIEVTGRGKLRPDEQAILDSELRNFDRKAAVEAALEAQRKINAVIEEGLAKEREAWEERKRAAEDFGGQVADIGVEFLDSMIWGTKSWKDALTDALTDLGRLMIEELVMKPLKAMIVSGIAKMLLSAAGVPVTPDLTGWGDGGSLIGSFSPGAAPGPKGMAHGGPIAAGQTAWVGEKGPELFTPGVDGSIIPNRRLGGGLTVVNHIDARGSTDEAATKRMVQEGIAQALPTITEAAKAKTVRFLQRPRMGG